MALSCGTIVSYPQAMVNWMLPTGYARQIAQSASMSNGSLFLKAPGPSHNGKVYVCSPYVMDSTQRQLNAETMGYIKVIVEGVCVYMYLCVYIACEWGGIHVCLENCEWELIMEKGKVVEEGEEVEDGEEVVEEGEEVVEEGEEVVEEGRWWWRNDVIMGEVIHFINKLFMAWNTLYLFYCVVLMWF